MLLTELKIQIQMNKTILGRDVPEALSKVINSYFLGNEKLENMHKGSHKVKLYSFGLTPKGRAEEPIQKGDYQELVVRFLDNDIAKNFEEQLYIKPNPLFIIKGILIDEIPLSEDVKFIYNITPSIMTNGSKYWVKNEDELDLVKERILKNTIKKYNALFETDLPVYDFIEGIEVMNKHGNIIFNYKNSKLVTNRFKIKIKQDVMSQKLAFIILGAGMLEKNSLSLGFSAIGRY